MPGTIDEGDVPQELEHAITARLFAGAVVWLVRPKGAERGRAVALRVTAPEHLGVGVTELDGDVPLELRLESDSLHQKRAEKEGSVSDQLHSGPDDRRPRR